MAPTELLQGLDVRRKLFALDERALAIVRDTWPVIAPHLGATIEEILVTAENVERTLLDYPQLFPPN